MNAPPSHEDWVWRSLSGALTRRKRPGAKLHKMYSATRTIAYLIAVSLASVFAQPKQNSSRDSLPDQSSQSLQQPKKPERRGSVVAVPIPISSPAIGSGVVLAGGYIFSLRKSDKVSQPSTVGAAVLIFAAITCLDSRLFGQLPTTQIDTNSSMSDLPCWRQLRNPMIPSFFQDGKIRSL